MIITGCTYSKIDSSRVKSRFTADLSFDEHKLTNVTDVNFTYTGIYRSGACVNFKSPTFTNVTDNLYLSRFSSEGQEFMIYIYADVEEGTPKIEKIIYLTFSPDDRGEIILDGRHN